MKHYLFVCKHNFTRSKYCAVFFKGYLKGKGIRAKVFSAGTSFSSYFLGKRLNKKFVKKFDLFFVMECWMKEEIIKKFGVCSNKIVILGIKDIYGFLRKKSIDDLDKLLGSFNWEKYL